MLSVVMLSVVMLSAVMLSVIMLSVIMPNVVAPKNCYLEFSKAKWNGKQTSCTIKLFYS
jgi:hypothetical protein